MYILARSSSSTDFELAVRTSDQVERSKMQIAEGEACLDATMATLSGIMTQPEQDARAQWARLVKDVDVLERQIGTIERQNGRMRQQADICFQSWETEVAPIESVELRRRSEVRHSEQMAQYRQTGSALSVARRAFDPLLLELKDLERYLSIDLTPAGGASAADLYERARQNAEKVKLAVSLAMDELNRMQSMLSPGEAAQQAA